MRTPLRLLLCAAAGTILVGCGETARPDGDRIYDGLAGQVRAEGERASLFGGPRTRPARPEDLTEENLLDDITFYSGTDIVNKHSLLQWNSRRDRYYSVMYKSRTNPRWQLLPHAINLRGTGEEMKVIDNSPGFETRAYRPMSSAGPIKGYTRGAHDPRMSRSPRR